MLQNLPLPFTTTIPNTMSADNMQTIEAMARLRTLVLANESQPADLHRCIPARARPESSSTIEGEVVWSQPAQRSACRCNYNKVAGVSLHESAASSPFLSRRAEAPAVQGRDSSERADDFLVERRLQQAFLSLRAEAPAVQRRDSSDRADDFLIERRLRHASAPSRGLPEGRKLLESSY